MTAPCTNFNIKWIFQQNPAFFYLYIKYEPYQKMCLSIVTLNKALKSYKYRRNASGNYLSQDIKQ